MFIHLYVYIYIYIYIYTHVIYIYIYIYIYRDSLNYSFLSNCLADSIARVARVARVAEGGPARGVGYVFKHTHIDYI